MGPNLIGRKFQVKNFPSHTSVSGIFPCSSVCIKTFHCLGIASLYRFSSNEMDPKVAKLLEGKSDEDRIKAIAFSFGCLLTRPTANSPPDAPMKDERRAKEKSRSEPKYSFEELSDEEDSSEWWMSDECSPKEIRFFCDDLFCTSSQQGIELAHEWFSIQGAQQMQVISSKVKYHATSSGCNGSSSLFVSVSKLNNSWNYGL